MVDNTLFIAISAVLHLFSMTKEVPFEPRWENGIAVWVLNKVHHGSHDKDVIDILPLFLPRSSRDMKGRRNWSTRTTGTLSGTWKTRGLVNKAYTHKVNLHRGQYDEAISMCQLIKFRQKGAAIVLNTYWDSRSLSNSDMRVHCFIPEYSIFNFQCARSSKVQSVIIFKRSHAIDPSFSEPPRYIL